jgi:hypothetical protein
VLGRPVGCLDAGRKKFLYHLEAVLGRGTPQRRGWGKGILAMEGGFIQEATGWKPSALQPHVYLPTLLHSIGR